MGNRRKGIAYLLATVLAMSPIAGFSSFGASLGDQLFNKSLTIAQETVLASGVYWNSGYNDKIAENYIEYKPGSTVSPRISYGNDIYGAPSFKTIVAQQATQGNYVVAGINGDYFNTNNGVALGMTIKNGILRTSESTANPSVGFFEDGTAIIGRAGLNVRADGPTLGNGIGMIHMNKTVTATSGVMLYTADFAEDNTNKAAIPTYNVLLDVVSGDARINGTIETSVFSASESLVPAVIPEGKLMISMSTGTAYAGTLTQLMGLNQGDQVTISFSASQDWENVTFAVGAGEKLLTDGIKMVPAGGEIHPRTAVGIRADGSVVFYTVDGRQPGRSAGLTLSQLADRLTELGCVEGVNMDGGGSTAIHTVYPGDKTTTNVNIAAQTPLRNCANYIFLVNTAAPTGTLSKLFAYPYNIQMLSGATQAFEVKATDQNYYAVTPPTSYTYSAASGLGSFNTDGLFTAGATTKSGDITIRYNSKLATTAKVSVVSQPDSVILVNQTDGKTVNTLSVTAGKTIDFSAQAIYNRMPLIATDRNFTWSVSGDIGTIDENGLLTVANITNGIGIVTATVGGKTATASIAVTSEGFLLESFETEPDSFTGALQNGLIVEANTDLAKVRYGYESAKVEYDFAAAGTAVLSLPTTVLFPKSLDSLNLWIYGDKSGNQLNLSFVSPEGQKVIEGAILDFSGWKQIVVTPPTGSTGLASINLTSTGKIAGTLYFDQIVGGVGYYVDLEPPTITANIIGQSLTASIEDAIDKELAAADITATYDGVPLAFYYDRPSKMMTAAIPAPDANMHRLSITAKDRSGNLVRSGLTIQGIAPERPFMDMKGHWAVDSTSYLFSLGIINGVQTDTGLYFNPDKQITRSEFSVMMSNWIGDAAAEYEDIVLPFADADAIPSWSLSAAKAMYGMGIVRGVEKNGKIYFNPTSAISREEVMTIIGRTQQRGFAENDLSGFTDNSQVSSWSLPYVRTLVKQGVVSGYDNKLWPKNPVTRSQVATMISNLN